MTKETAAKISLEDGTEVEISETELDAFQRNDISRRSWIALNERSG